MLACLPLSRHRYYLIEKHTGEMEGEGERERGREIRLCQFDPTEPQAPFQYYPSDHCGGKHCGAGMEGRRARWMKEGAVMGVLWKGKEAAEKGGE